MCNFVPVLFREGDQFGVWRITFVGKVRSEHAAIWLQGSLSTETADMFNNLAGAQMVTSDLVLSICVIQNHNIKLHLLIPEYFPRLFQQCARIRAVEHGTTIRRHGVQHCS